MQKLARDERTATGSPLRGRSDPTTAVTRLPEVPVRRREGADLSLRAKILFGYLLAGGVVAVALWWLPRDPVWWAVVTGGATLFIGQFITTVFALVRRVATVNRAALEISRGDLSKAVVNQPGLGRDEIDELSTAVSHMQENLRELVGHIQRTSRSVADSANDLQRSAEGVNTSTDEVSSSMHKIAKGADEQSRLVEHASKLMGEMASSIKTATRSAEDATRASSDTSGAAEFSGNAARLAGEKVKKVFSGIEAASKEVFAFGDQTKEINKIVDAISHVAQQTNLLALNATIEAARAGEYGRGFAVVAEEVRKLAESAGRSAEQISRLAGGISDHASSVVAAMKDAITELGEGREDLNSIIRALETITDTARKGAEKVANISEAAREQLQNGEEMVKAVNLISSVAQQNASSTQQVSKVIEDQTGAVAQMTSAAQELNNLSVEMQTVVSRFKLQ
jgi:methyl-accepting chemotaxis protein